VAARDSLLTVAGACKRYGPVTAIEDVSLHLRAGEKLALAGENGSGKSTLVKIIAGVTPPDRGRIVFDGHEQSFASPRQALGAGIALVSQEPACVPAMSIGENVMLASLQRGAKRFSRRSVRAAAKQHLRTVGLVVDPDRPLRSLRTGERALAEIAKGLASNPRVLLLDEVTTRLPDPAAILDLVARLSEQGVATIFITHRLREIRELADRVVVLRDGRWVGELEREEVDDDRLATMMVGRELKGYFHKGRPQSGEVALRVDGLVVEGSKQPVSFKARAGEIVGVAGLMGAGRSELLEALAGARRVRSGTVEVGGRRVACSSPVRAMASGIALVPEDRLAQGLVADASVCDNIAMGRTRALARTRRGAERQMAAKAVRDLRIRTSSVGAPIASLSGGNQQKVVIARAVGRAPKVLLLDEPTRGVDVGAREDIYRLIGGFVERGMAVVMVSSDLLEVLALSDRILVMCEGEVVGELDRAEATEERIALLSAGGGGDDVG
jgi:ABC-type sugar transport system ATPase subunit